MIHRRTLLAAFSALLVVTLTPSGVAAEDFASSRVTVTATGSGKDVILIPGHSSSPRVWNEMIDAVPGYRYHKVQVKGFAGLPKDGNGDGDVVASVAEEVARYIAEQRLGEASVIGHSMGGTIGMIVAARHPDAVSKLMIVDMVPFLGGVFGGPEATAESVKPIAESFRANIADTPAAAYTTQLDRIVAGMVRTESRRAAALDDAKRTDRNVASRSYAELILTDLRPELPKITAKTVVLYVAPNADTPIDAAYQAAYANMKDVTLTRIPDAAHFVMWDNAPRFQAEVKAFLAD